MIIKTLRQSITDRIVPVDTWEYYPKVRGLKIDKPLEVDAEGIYKEHYRISFTYGDDNDFFNLPIMDFEQIYLLNDEGKTVETIRNVSFARDRIIKKALADEAVRQINSAPDDMQISSVATNATKPTQS